MREGTDSTAGWLDLEMSATWQEAQEGCFQEQSQKDGEAEALRVGLGDMRVLKDRAQGQARTLG